jgi:hypothetical protein
MIRFTQKQSTRVFVLTTMILLSATTALPMQGDSATRVRFPRGRTTVILKGSVRGTKYYVLNAKEGQTMSVRLTAPKPKTGFPARFTMYLSDDRAALVNTSKGAEDVTEWTGVLPKSGDYVIYVEVLGPKTRYTLAITVK